jgi:hypothetical protein
MPRPDEPPEDPEHHHESEYEPQDTVERKKRALVRRQNRDAESRQKAGRKQPMKDTGREIPNENA